MLAACMDPSGLEPAAPDGGTGADTPMPGANPEAAQNAVTKSSIRLPGVGLGLSGFPADVMDTSTNNGKSFAWTRAAAGIGYARIFVPWNALASTDAQGNCVYENPRPTYYGTPWWDMMQAELQGAVAQGLIPIISITNQVSNPFDPQNPSDAGYVCGVSKIMYWTNFLNPNPVTEWEAYNEPDASNASAQQTAKYWSDAVWSAAIEGVPNYTIVAGAFMAGQDYSNSAYIRSYVLQLANTDQWPKVWSLHPYDDVARSYQNCGYLGAPGCNTNNTSDFVTSINNVYKFLGVGFYPEFWLTESAVWLEDPAHRALNGNARQQANAAMGFLNLSRARGQVYPHQISRLYWHQYVGSPTGPVGWDSGLVKGDGIPTARTSACVLTGYTPAQAVASPKCNSFAASFD
jgi:hypothetical protein